MSAISCVGQRAGARLLALADDPEHGGLEAAEAEVEIAFEVRRIAIGVRQPRARQPHGPIVAGLRQPIDDRSARIPRPRSFATLS